LRADLACANSQEISTQSAAVSQCCAGHQEFLFLFKGLLLTGAIAENSTVRGNSADIRMHPAIARYFCVVQVCERRVGLGNIFIVLRNNKLKGICKKTKTCSVFEVLSE
jgi:hypothetical protein